MTQLNKYFLYTSLIFNGGLLLYLFGPMPFFLFLSASVNIGLVWYVKKFVDKDSNIESDIIAIVEKIDAFSEHIEDLHQLEMYYGDENLQKLMEHSNELVNYFIDFQQEHFDVEVQEIEDAETPETEDAE
jgi:hypothetical protein|tara:strand:- start:2552 stop:2941 length:390 start_codon:yes stop_codon:yes gene_type:complete